MFSSSVFHTETNQSTRNSDHEQKSCLNWPENIYRSVTTNNVFKWIWMNEFPIRGTIKTLSKLNQNVYIVFFLHLFPQYIYSYKKLKRYCTMNNEQWTVVLNIDNICFYDFLNSIVLLFIVESQFYPHWNCVAGLTVMV